MRAKADKLDGKHPEVARDAMEDLKDRNGNSQALKNDTRYMEPNRDRFLGDADRTGRHFDEQVEERKKGTEHQGTEESSNDHEAAEASKDHEAD